MCCGSVLPWRLLLFNEGSRFCLRDRTMLTFYAKWGTGQSLGDVALIDRVEVATHLFYRIAREEAAANTIKDA